MAVKRKLKKKAAPKRTKKPAGTVRKPVKAAPPAVNNAKQNDNTVIFIIVMLFSLIIGLVVGIIIGKGAAVIFKMASGADPGLKAASTQYVADDIPQLLETAKKAYSKDDFNKALEIYRKVMLMDPDNHDANLFSATIYAENLDPPDRGAAIYHTKKALDSKMEYIVLLAYGGLYWNSGDYASAEKIFRDCVEMEPENFKGWWHLGFMQEKLDKAKEAVKSYKKASSLCRDEEEKKKIEYRINMLEK